MRPYWFLLLGVLVIASVLPSASVPAAQVATPTAVGTLTNTLTPVSAFTPVPRVVMTASAPRDYTTRRAVNLRREPTRSSEVITILPGGTLVQVIGSINGEQVRVGNRTWYIINYGDHVAYLYSNTVVPGRPYIPSTPLPSATPGLPAQVVPTVDPLLSIPLDPTFPPFDEGQPIFECNGIDDLNCENFDSWEAANDHLLLCGDEDLLDPEGFGVACEGLL
jgi:uncharacterized protein YgiM (DUF1202 family)